MPICKSRLRSSYVPLPTYDQLKAINSNDTVLNLCPRLCPRLWKVCPRLCKDKHLAFAHSKHKRAVLARRNGSHPMLAPLRSNHSNTHSDKLCSVHRLQDFFSRPCSNHMEIVSSSIGNRTFFSTIESSKKVSLVYENRQYNTSTKQAHTLRSRKITFLICFCKTLVFHLTCSVFQLSFFLISMGATYIQVNSFFLYSASLKELCLPEKLARASKNTLGACKSLVVLGIHDDMCLNKTTFDGKEKAESFVNNYL